MRSETEFDFEALLCTLAAHGVEMIVVGGVCAVLHGAPEAAFDLDIVHARTRENIGRLLKALEELDARYRAAPLHDPLTTRSGPLDILGRIGAGREYGDLLPHSAELRIDEGLSVRVLDLETLIETKEETAGEKDLAVLPILRRVLAERARS